MSRVLQANTNDRAVAHAIRKLLRAGLCVLWLSVAAKAADDRPLLENALAAARLRDLALIAAHEAYTTHAETLGSEKIPSGIAWCYVGSLECLAGDRVRAELTLQTARKLLSPASPADTKSLEAARADADDWAARLLANLLETAGSSTGRTSQWLSRKLRPAQPEVTLRMTLPKEAGRDPDLMTFDLIDPAQILNGVELARSQLPTAATTRAEWLLVAWTCLLDQDIAGVYQAIQQFDALPRADDASQAERLCLGAAAAAQSGDSRGWESSLKELDESPLSLWGLRALTLAPCTDSRVVAIGQDAIRELVGDVHPFASSLLYPQERAEQAAAQRRRDWYWEVGALHSAQAQGDQGFWPVSQPRLPALRAARLLSDLTSPLRRANSSSLSRLQKVTLALGCARAGEFESWWNDQDFPEDALWQRTLQWARVASGARRTQRGSLMPANNPDLFVDSPAVLLAGETFQDSLSSQASGIEGSHAGRQPDETQNQRVWVGLAAAAAFVLAGAWWLRQWSRNSMN